MMYFITVAVMNNQCAQLQLGNHYSWVNPRSLSSNTMSLCGTCSKMARKKVMVANLNTRKMQAGDRLLNHPVINVNWHDAKAYAQCLSKKTSRPSS